MLEVRNLSYSYSDGRLALQEVNFTLSSGGKLALLGPNGAGKSTLLRQLAGAEFQPGTLWINGSEVQKASTLREYVGLVFQNPDDQLFCSTIGEDVGYGLCCRGWKPPELQERVRETLAMVGLASHLDRSPQSLSGGEKKRAALATVLALQPSLLVLDEPLAGLDARARREVIQALSSLSTSLVVATHDLDLAREITPEALILDQGRVVYQGPTLAILQDRDLLMRHGLEA